MSLPPAEEVADTASQHQPRRDGHGIAGDHPFDGGWAGVEALLNGRQGDVDDEEIEDVHEGAAHEYGQGRPVPEKAVSNRGNGPWSEPDESAHAQRVGPPATGESRALPG